MAPRAVSLIFFFRKVFTVVGVLTAPVRLSLSFSTPMLLRDGLVSWRGLKSSQDSILATSPIYISSKSVVRSVVCVTRRTKIKTCLASEGGSYISYFTYKMSDSRRQKFLLGEILQQYLMPSLKLHLIDLGLGKF